MNKRIKKLVSAIVSFVLMLALATPSFAGSTEILQIFIHDGVTYVISEAVDHDGNKTVTVTGGGETATVVFDGEYLHIVVQNERTRSVVEQTILFEPAVISEFDAGHSVLAETDHGAMSTEQHCLQGKKQDVLLYMRSL